MLDRFKIKPKPVLLTNWRTYQKKQKRSAALKQLFAVFLKYIVATPLLFYFLYKIIGGPGGVESHPNQTATTASSRNTVAGVRFQKKLWDKKGVQTLFDRQSFLNLESKNFELIYENQKLNVQTSLDLSLQRFIYQKLYRSTSRYIGIVVMNPLHGRILAMVSFDKTDPYGNPNINQFPAASIFKIVTAAAAVDKYGFNPSTEFLYNGKKHTLYKSQLKKRINKYTRRITFQDAFAQSVNPVFGKIGVHYLDGSDIERYATAFGFNRTIDFEIPVSPSLVSLTQEPYHWAEIASGFNTETKISPLHAALIASAVLNQGQLIEPSIVDKITNQKGEILYRHRVTTLNQAITPRASAVITDLMEATIRSGTAKKSFAGYRRDKVLSRLKMGGKTGSIDNKLHDARFDWFVGFAEEKDGSEKIVLSVLVAHEKYIGIRASQYARLAIKHYFRNYFNRQTATLKKNQPS